MPIEVTSGICYLTSGMKEDRCLDGSRGSLDEEAEEAVGFEEADVDARGDREVVEGPAVALLVSHVVQSDDQAPDQRRFFLRRRSTLNDGNPQAWKL